MKIRGRNICLYLRRVHTLQKQSPWNMTLTLIKFHYINRISTTTLRIGGRFVFIFQSKDWSHIYNPG
jgi:hypothetical protein